MDFDSGLRPKPLRKARDIDRWWFLMLAKGTVWVEAAALKLSRSIQ